MVVFAAALLVRLQRTAVTVTLVIGGSAKEPEWHQRLRKNEMELLTRRFIRHRLAAQPMGSCAKWNDVDGDNDGAIRARLLYSTHCTGCDSRKTPPTPDGKTDDEEEGGDIAKKGFSFGFHWLCMQASKYTNMHSSICTCAERLLLCRLRCSTNLAPVALLNQRPNYGNRWNSRFKRAKHTGSNVWKWRGGVVVPRNTWD